MPNPNTHLKKGKVVFCHILAPPPPQTFWSLPRLVSKFCKKRTPPNLPCQIQIRTRKKERSSSVISWHHHHHCKLFGVFQGSYQNSVKSVPPLIYHAKSKYALKKRKGRLPSYLGNEGSYQKTVKGIPSLIYHAKFKYVFRKMERSSRTF